MTPTRRYLIVGPAWVGDMVMAQSLFKTIRQRNPAALIDVLAPEWSLPLLGRMPEVNEAIALPVQHGQLALLTRYRLGRQLRNKGFTQAIVLPRSAKAALVPFFARVPVRTGFRGELRYGLINDMRQLDKTMLVQTVQRMVALGMPAEATQPANIPEPRLAINADNQQRLFEKLGLQLDRPVIGMMPGAAYGPAKQWPVSSFHRLATQLIQSGYQVWVFGSASEAGLGEQIAEAGQAVRSLCGQTELVDAIDLLALCKAAVSNDSGLMHVAAACEIPLVALYGSSTPAYTPPLSDRAQIVYLGLDCSPCFQRQCPLGHTRCLVEMTVDQVHDALGRAMAGQ
jgi:heptosyltransferase-2